jgi:hypothetical protein
MDAHRLNPPAIATNPSTIEVILEQHVEDAAMLAARRRQHVAAPHVNLRRLVRWTST